MKDINHTVEFYPEEDGNALPVKETPNKSPEVLYVHEYYTKMCEIDFCRNVVTSLFLLQSGDASPMCEEHADEYRRKAKNISNIGNILSQKDWEIIIND